MVKAKRSALAGMDGKRNELGGPSFSRSALETLMSDPDFAVLAAGSSAAVMHHEEGGRSRMLLLIGRPTAVLLEEAEASARQAGAARVMVEVSPDSPVLPALEAMGYHRAGEAADHFGRGRPAVLMEKQL
ncbi:MAG TPA: hypothetical protein P5063_01465 [Methanomassiliicoccales archaeon]|nr:hypothetical protein [Methanomassiliicoccales archaeon]